MTTCTILWVGCHSKLPLSALTAAGIHVVDITARELTRKDGRTDKSTRTLLAAMTAPPAAMDIVVMCDCTSDFLLADAIHDAARPRTIVVQGTDRPTDIEGYSILGYTHFSSIDELENKIQEVCLAVK